ncbi:MAG TPA: hypothetical protein VGM50_06160 [Gemmatimonadaceae bacterium]|jgi:hypothetical protein
MMMAHDSSPGPPTGLDQQTIEMVRAALVNYVSVPTSLSVTPSRATPAVQSASGTDHRGEALRVALHTMAAEARAKSVLPESLLVLLKDIWYSLTHVHTKLEQPDQVRLLQRVVTMCIKEYYAD